MSVFDLLFIFIFLGSVITVLTTLINLLGGCKPAAKRTSRVLCIGLGAYLLIVALVAIMAPQKVILKGQDRCFDEMCFAVTDLNITPAIGNGRQQLRAGGRFYLVTIRV
jgi:hypothetical protein